MSGKWGLVGGALAVLVGAGLVLVLTTTGSAATSRQLMNLQGRLTDAPGNPGMSQS